MRHMKGNSILCLTIIGTLFDIRADAFGSAARTTTRTMITSHNIVPFSTLGRREQPLLTQRTRPLMSSAEGSSSTTEKTPPAEMKLRDIQAELKGMGVSYADCFDRESLMRRLEEARRGEHATTTTTDSEAATDKNQNPSDNMTEETTTASKSSTPETPPETKSPPKSEPSPPSKEFDREATLTELRSLRVSELRTRLASRQIRWANMIEKEDLVQALVNAMEISSQFSLSGALTPGECTDINSDQLATELSENAGRPLLLDVYATWCGPCKMMAPQMNMAAADLGDRCRVAKIDSDLNQKWSAKLRVEGLPTVIVFDENGKEVGRREGLLMKSNLIDLVERSTGMK